MSSTQIHLIDPCAGMVLVIGSDGSRLLYGSRFGAGTANEILQRLFEVLEDGKIDYFVHSGFDADGPVTAADITDMFPIETCLEPEGEGFALPQIYENFRAEREVETLEPDDVWELGDTQVRIIAGPHGRETAEGRLRPVGIHVSHGEDPAGGSVLCTGPLNGLDWLDLGEATAEQFRSDVLIVDGRFPLDIILTARDRGLVSADPLRWIAPRTVLLGADPDGENKLRVAARELYGHIVTRHPGGRGLVELSGKAWISLTLDGTNADLVQEQRALGKVA
ncbi:ComEC/Rec2 family competence protein [Alsobacter sp. R-9]